MTMEILVIGLNHATAPVAVREKITFPGNSEGDLTRRLLRVRGVEEVVILSTCNRAEVIAATPDADSTANALIEDIGGVHGLEVRSFLEYLYVKRGAQAVRHVFRVASSLDSMVVGEPQILGQVKDAYRIATESNTTGPLLNRLMHRAFFTAKRIRNETGVGIAAVSVAYVAVELAKKILGELKQKRVLLIGAGEMAELAARHLLHQVDLPIVVVNRTYQNAVCLAQELRGHARPMEELDRELDAADVVITSTGSCQALITKPQMKGLMKRRRFKPIFLIDIAIPRDVDPEVNDIEGVYVYNIDDLQAVVEENIGERRQEALRGETIVADEVTKFVSWMGTLDSAPTIVALKDKLERIRAGELARLNGKLGALTPEQRETVEVLTRSIINKIAHDPIVFLKQSGNVPKRNLYLDLAQRLFDLGGAGPHRSREKDNDEG
ncbi:MAG: glutamyl-tRNA reductase [Thermodesulfobacteriota bacterium]